MRSRPTGIRGGKPCTGRSGKPRRRLSSCCFRRAFSLLLSGSSTPYETAEKKFWMSICVRGCRVPSCRMVLRLLCTLHAKLNRWKEGWQQKVLLRAPAYPPCKVVGHIQMLMQLALDPSLQHANAIRRQLFHLIGAECCDSVTNYCAEKEAANGAVRITPSPTSSKACLD